MTYKIDYQTKEGKWDRVFDIEFSLTYSESNCTKKEWYSEIDVTPCVEGLIWLARDLDSSKIGEFVRDSAVISELRAELYEGGELWRGLISHNEPTYIDVAEQRHYHELKPMIEQRLREYCEKYNLSLNVDWTIVEEKKERKFGDFGDYLDAPEDRRKALAVLKEKLLLLIEDWWDIQLIDHPVHLKEKEERSDKNYEELIFRMQDYEVFMYDYQKDWDLNYQDYGLDRVYENND